MYVINGVLPSWMAWFQILNANLLFMNDSMIVYKIFLMIVMNIIYFISLILSNFYNPVVPESYERESSKNLEMGIQILNVCRIFEFILNLLRLIWNLAYSPGTFRVLQSLADQEDKNTSKKTEAKMKILYIIVLIYILVQIFFTDSTEWQTISKISGIVNWIFVLIKDTNEISFTEAILTKFRYLFEEVNQQLYQILVLIHSHRKMHINEEELENLIFFEMRKASSRHYQLVDAMKDFENIKTRNIALRLIMDIAGAVNVTYFLIDYFPIKQKLLVQSLWTIHQLSKTIYMIAIWNSQSLNANKTVIIQHDLWNEYAEKKGIHKRMLYMQFVCLRFLSCNLKITAHGLFPLDWPFLHTIVASATTFIIILVQLKK